MDRSTERRDEAFALFKRQRLLRHRQLLASALARINSTIQQRESELQQCLQLMDVLNSTELTGEYREAKRLSDARAAFPSFYVNGRIPHPSVEEQEVKFTHDVFPPPTLSGYHWSKRATEVLRVTLACDRVTNVNDKELMYWHRMAQLINTKCSNRHRLRLNGLKDVSAWECRAKSEHFLLSVDRSDWKAEEERLLLDEWHETGGFNVNLTTFWLNVARGLPQRRVFFCAAKLLRLLRRSLVLSRMLTLPCLRQLLWGYAKEGLGGKSSVSPSLRTSCFANECWACVALYVNTAHLTELGNNVVSPAGLRRAFDELQFEALVQETTLRWDSSKQVEMISQSLVRIAAALCRGVVLSTRRMRFCESTCDVAAHRERLTVLIDKGLRSSQCLRKLAKVAQLSRGTKGRFVIESNALSVENSCRLLGLTREQFESLVLDAVRASRMRPSTITAWGNFAAKEFGVVELGHACRTMYQRQRHLDQRTHLECASYPFSRVDVKFEEADDPDPPEK